MDFILFSLPNVCKNQNAFYAIDSVDTFNYLVTIQFSTKLMKFTIFLEKG